MDVHVRFCSVYACVWKWRLYVRACFVEALAVPTDPAMARRALMYRVSLMLMHSRVLLVARPAAPCT